MISNLQDDHQSKSVHSLLNHFCTWPSSVQHNN